jgi:hypothetical protein
MKRKAIVAILALTSISPVAQANEVARIQSAPGQSQSSWIATAEFQAFQCPTGTSRGGGVDMNFTTDSRDDYYFATCSEVTSPAITPNPTPTTSPSVSDTSTATVQTSASSTAASSSGSTSTSSSTVTTTETTTATAAFDYQAFFQMFIAWFQNWFAQFLATWGR